MAGIGDYGQPGDPLAAPSLSAWAAAVSTHAAAVDAGLAGKWTRWVGTQAQYDALPTKDPNTLYVVTA